MAADLRGTGYPDLFVANDYGVSELYLNEGGKSFREAGKETGVGSAPKSGMNAAVGDVLNQGRFGIYVSNISEEGVLVQGNNLWMPQTGTPDDGITVREHGQCHGRRTGRLEFRRAVRRLEQRRLPGSVRDVTAMCRSTANRTYWYDYSKVAGGNQGHHFRRGQLAAAGRAAVCPGYQQKQVWVNDGAGQFKEVAQLVGVTDVYDGRSVALADFGNRGVLDAVVANQKGPLLLYRNTVSPGNRWIEFELEGSASNRSAIGAQVTLFWNGQQQVQEVSGGSGFCAQNQRRLHFGLGKAGRRRSGGDSLAIRQDANDSGAGNRIRFTK